jgi:ribonuclease P protein component
VVAPVRSREDFAALSRSRARGSSGPIWIVHAPPTHAEHRVAQVAYAVSKKVGSAVVRNRVRRRLRPLMDDLDANGLLPPGGYLIGVRPDVVELPSAELRRHLVRAVASSTGVRS